jgi:hypothetical protein
VHIDAGWEQCSPKNGAAVRRQKVGKSPAREIGPAIGYVIPKMVALMRRIQADLRRDLSPSFRNRQRTFFGTVLEWVRKTGGFLAIPKKG